jgi:type II secretory pathway component PulF
VNPDPPKNVKKQQANDDEKEKLTRKLQQAEMTILGYEEKLKQANKTIDKLKEKEEQVCFFHRELAFLFSLF